MSSLSKRILCAVNIFPTFAADGFGDPAIAEPRVLYLRLRGLPIIVEPSGFSPVRIPRLKDAYADRAYSSSFAQETKT
jgi:hypothetical protein